MNKPNNCLRCNGSNILGPFRMYETAISLGALSSGAKFDAYVCADCGHTELIVKEKDMYKIRKKGA